MAATSLALVGATGGAGTTRTAVELAAMGARDGRSVAVVDAAYATQGLSEYVSDRITTDVTGLVTDDRDESLASATHEVGDALPGTVALVPARAPFERLARAKTAEAARALGDRIEEAATAYDHVVVDTPPVASNQAVAAVMETDRVAGVLPASRHGRDALQRLRGRIEDVGGDLHLSVATGGDVPPADAALPEPAGDVASAPEVGSDDGPYAEAVARAFEVAFRADLDVEFGEDGVLGQVKTATEQATERIGGGD